MLSLFFLTQKKNHEMYCSVPPTKLERVKIYRVGSCCFFFKTVLYHLALFDNGVPAKLDRFKVLQNLMLLFKLFQWPSIGGAVNPHFCTNPFGHRIPFCAPKKSPFDMYISYMYMYCMYIYM